MKKITLLLSAMAAFSGQAFGQANISVEAPRYDGYWSALLGPNGFSSPSVASPTLTYAYNTSCYLITQAELSRMITTNSVVTAFGLDLYRPGSVPVAGQFTLYLENTSDVTYNKGMTFSNAIASMSTHYSGSLTIPGGGGATQQATASISLPLSNNFTYTGDGIYVAFEWQATAPTSTMFARYLATYDGTVVPMGASAMAPVAGPAPTTLSVSAARPAMRFTMGNTSSNEVEVVSMKAPGLVSRQVNPGHSISAIIKNNSLVALSNVPVTLNVSGANTYANTQTVTSIAPGATTTVDFTPFASTANGLNTMSVTVPADDYADNDRAVWSQTVNCVDYGNNPPFPAASFSHAAYGYPSQAIMATPFRSSVTTSITGIKYAPPSFDQPDFSMCGVIMDGSGSILATTNTITLNKNNYGTFANLTFNPAIELNANTNYYYGMAQLTAPSYPFANFEAMATQNVNLYYYVPITGGTVGGAQNAMGYLGMQAVLAFSNTTIEAAASQTILCKGDVGTTVTLTATGGTSTFTWTPGNVQSSSVVVTPTVVGQSGIVNYNVSGTDATSGCRSNVVTVSVRVDACTGLSGNLAEAGIRLFPNPAVHGKSAITGLTGTNQVTVMNTLGQVVLTKQVSEETIEIDLSGQPSGNYLVRITNPQMETRTIKVINQN